MRLKPTHEFKKILEDLGFDQVGNFRFVHKNISYGSIEAFFDLEGKNFKARKKNILGYGMEKDEIFGETWIETDVRVPKSKSFYRIPIILCDELPDKLDKIINT